MSASTVFFSLLGGVLPALLWLWFWLREDRLNPEPRGIIIMSFFAGMAAVMFALPAEQWIWKAGWSTTAVIIAWAAIEEIAKFFAAYFSGLRRKEYDEPIDALIYLITAALGFAALENTLFLSGILSKGILFDGISLGILRFVGASLLHVLASGTLGFFLGIGFYKRRSVKEIDWFIGLIAAIALHSVFNLFIINGAGSYTVTVFAFVWLSVILLMLGFEKVKQIREPQRP